MRYDTIELTVRWVGEWRRWHGCATAHRFASMVHRVTGAWSSGNIFGDVVSWSEDLDGEITLNVEGKFLPFPGGHPVAAAFTVKIQQFGGAGVGHWTLEVDGAVFCIETLKSGQIVLRRL